MLCNKSLIMTYVYALTIAPCFNASGVFAGAGAGSKHEVTRSQFAIAMASIQQGMREGQVMAILGRPDEVRTGKELTNDYPPRIKQVLCYGALGHGTFPTLGQIYIDRDGKVDYVAGKGGTPPDQRLFTEIRLRQILTLLDRAPQASGRTYAPLEMIKIVNSLVALGKERALAAMSEYLRVAPQWPREPDGIWLVLRVLFEIPSRPGYLPEPLLGSPWPAVPKDPKILPRFPMAVIDDVPLLLVSDYAVLGAGSVPPDLEYFRKHCHARTKPLRPTNQPFVVLPKLMESTQWVYSTDLKSSDSNSGKVLLINQLLRLVSSVYRTDIDFEKYGGTEGTELNRLWRDQIQRFSQKGVFWDPDINEYVLKKHRGTS
jgi:hypothetical protein